jgi:Glycosyl hydrolases family 16
MMTNSGLSSIGRRCGAVVAIGLIASAFGLSRSAAIDNTASVTPPRLENTQLTNFSTSDHLSNAGTAYCPLNTSVSTEYGKLGVCVEVAPTIYGYLARRGTIDYTVKPALFVASRGWGALVHNPGRQVVGTCSISGTKYSYEAALYNTRKGGRFWGDVASYYGSVVVIRQAIVRGGGGCKFAPNSSWQVDVSSTVTPPPTPTPVPIPIPQSENCSSTLSAPAGWTAGERTFDDTFQNLNNWNYGIGGNTGNYYPWSGSGTAPYYGSSEHTYASDYDVPGNVSQTSSGANSSLFSTYSPQDFSSTGCGVTFTAHYTGARNWSTTNEGILTDYWTSGAINTYDKVSFPTNGNTSFYVQIKAQMMGYNGINNGAWNALWLLPVGNWNEDEIDLQETGLQDNNSPNYVNSTLQSSPSQEIDSYKSSSDLSAGYHTYGIEVTSNGKITTYLDNVQIGSINDGTGLTGPYYLIMNGALFKQGKLGVGWTNTNDMKMNIAEVQVYQR